MLERNVSFRGFNEADLLVYCQWFLDGELSSRLDYPSDTWFSYIESAASECWVALIEDDLVGVLQIDAALEGSAPMDIVLRPDLRRRGLGKKVLQAFLSQFGAKYRAISAFIEADDTASLECFSSSGFGQVKDVDDDGFIEFIYVAGRS